MTDQAPNAAVPSDRVPAALLAAAERFAADLSQAVATAVTVAPGGQAAGPAAHLLPEIGEAVVAFERSVAGSAEGALLVLCAGGDAAWLATVAAGEAPQAQARRADGFLPEKHEPHLRKALCALTQTAAAVLDPPGGLTLDEPTGQIKVFALDQDLNRAVSFLGEGNLVGARLVISSGEAGEAAVWLLARPELAAPLETRLPPAGSAGRPATPGDVRRLLHISVPVIVTLAEKRMKIDAILNLSVGKVIEFPKSSDAFLDLMVNNQRIGRGEAVKVGDRFGLRIVEIGDVKDTIRKLGGSGSQPPV